MWSFLFLFLLVMQLLIMDNMVSTDSKVNHRVKRVMDRPPTEKPSEPPPTSEEIREKESGTESPHVYDYPDAIYKSHEYRQGEWNRNPIAKKKTMNVTRKATDDQQQSQSEQETPKQKTKQKSSSLREGESSTNSMNSPLTSLFSNLFGKT